MIKYFVIFSDDKITASRKSFEQLLQLILKCLKHPGPNLSHYLLGFNLRKPIATTEIQEPGKNLYTNLIIIIIIF